MYKKISLLIAFLITIFAFASASLAVDVIQNGNFDNNMEGWFIYPKVMKICPDWSPLKIDDETGDKYLSLGPPLPQYRGELLFQSLNISNIADKSYTLSLSLWSDYTLSGKSVEVSLIYVDSSDNVKDIFYEIDNSDIGVGNPEVLNFEGTFPQDARKLLAFGIEIVGWGEIYADNISLDISGISEDTDIGSIPLISTVSPTSLSHGDTFTITGQNFGDTQDRVLIAGKEDGITILSWSDTEIKCQVDDPVSKGPVVVVKDFVKSNPDKWIDIQSPYFNIWCTECEKCVIKGMETGFPIGVGFFNDFSPDSKPITFTIANPPDGMDYTFTPGSTLAPGGTLLKIDTENMNAGEYELTVVAGHPDYADRKLKLELNIYTVQEIALFFDDEEIQGDPLQITVTNQGIVDIKPEVTLDSGETFDLRYSPYGRYFQLDSSNEDVILPVIGTEWNDGLYAIDDGTAIATLTSPDNFSITLTVNVAISDPKILTATFDQAEIPNSDYLTHTFTAIGEDSLAGQWHGNWGNIAFKYDEFEVSDFDVSDDTNDYRKYHRDFIVDHENTPLGTYLFYATLGKNKRVAPLKIVNDNSKYGIVKGRVFSVDPKLSPFALEVFTLEFYDSQTGDLSFKKEIWAHHNAGRFMLGGIEPGTYLVRCNGESKSSPSFFDPQWYLNSASPSDAQVITVTAGTETEIHFFVKSRSKEDKLYDTVRLINMAYNSKDIDTFMSFVSYDYLDNGQNRDSFRNEIEADFRSSEFQPITLTVQNIQYQDDMAIVDVLIQPAGEQEQFYCKYEYNQWKLIGNQKTFEAEAISGVRYDAEGNPKQYWVEFVVYDPNQSFESVAVAGPGIVTQTYLIYHTDEGAWTSWSDSPEYSPFHAFFDQAPSLPLTYTFTLKVRDTQETKSEVVKVTGFLDVYATQISPGKDASVYSDPVFSWQLSSGDPSQFRYGVELFGEGFYWRSDKSDQTTISYSGQDLQSGPYKFFIEISDRYTNRFSLTEGGPFFYGTLAKAEVKGSVKTMAPGYEAGIQGATITLKKIDTGEEYTAQTDQNGNWSIPDVPAGTYNMIITAPYHAPFTQEVEVTSEGLNLQPQTLEVSGGVNPWDVNRNRQLDLGDIIFQLQLLSGMRSID